MLVAGLFTYQSDIGRNVTLLDHERSHNFAGYVINTAGLEDRGCR